MHSSMLDDATPATWLFCIGQMKAGTTWFYDSTLPSGDIFTPPVKELRILATFDRFGAIRLLDKVGDTGLGELPGFRPHQTKTFLEYPQVFIRQFASLYGTVGSQPLTSASVGQLEWWLRYLGDTWTPETFAAVAGLRREKYIVDASPCSLVVSHRSLTLLQRAVPNPKIVVLLRNPLRRLFSALWMYPEWRPALETGSFRSLVEFSSALPRFNVLRDLLRHSFVDEALSGWRHVYGDNRIFVIVMEEVARHRQTIQERLNDFLGLDSLQLLPERRNRSSAYECTPDALKFLKTMVDGVSRQAANGLNLHVPCEAADEEFWNDMTEIQSGVLAARRPAAVRVRSAADAAMTSLERSAPEFLAAFPGPERHKLAAWMAAAYWAQAKEDKGSA